MQLSKGQIGLYHADLIPPGSIASETDCLAVVERLGFLWAFTPGTQLLPALFPGLATEQEGQRWEWAWTWKDRLSESRRAYYGKVVGEKPTLVSLTWLPCFYALTGNTGDPDDDLVHVAESTRLPELAGKVHHYLRAFGPTGTRTLQAKLTDGTREMRQAVDKAITCLDTAMLIAKVGAEGGNSIANMWDLMPRAFPAAVDEGTAIPTREAALRLVRQFFTLTPAVTVRVAERLFLWNARHVQAALDRMKASGELIDCKIEKQVGLCRADLPGRD